MCGSLACGRVKGAGVIVVEELEARQVAVKQLGRSHNLGNVRALEDLHDGLEHIEAFLIHGIALDEVLFEHGVRPAPEIDTLLGLHAVAHGQDYVEVVVLRFALNGLPAFILDYGVFYWHYHTGAVYRGADGKFRYDYAFGDDAGESGIVACAVSAALCRRNQR